VLLSDRDLRAEIDAGRLGIDAEMMQQAAEIRDAVNILETNPHIAVYIDGGAADALSAGRTSTAGASGASRCTAATS